MSVFNHFIRQLGIDLENELGGPSRDGEIQDDAQYSATDRILLLELNSIQKRLEDYIDSPCNLAQLKFKVSSGDTGAQATQNTGLSDSHGNDSVLASLCPIAVTTKQVQYRLHGFRQLLVALRALECTPGPMVTRRDSLVYNIELEEERLISAIHQEKELHENMGTHHNGARRIHLTSSAPDRFIPPVAKAIIILIAILHCIMGVAREHCGFVLKCLRCILQIIFQAQQTRSHLAKALLQDVPMTLPTALRYLGLQDNLDMHVVCPTCWAVFKDEGTGEPATCTATNIEGLICGDRLYTTHHRGTHSWSSPRRRFSHHRLESWLSRFLNRPGIEDLLEQSRPIPQSACTDVWGASLLCNFPGNGRPSFFDTPSNELRLAFVIYHDFFNPFGNKVAGKRASVGLVLMACLNLPPDIRYDLENIYVAALIPGPKEPALEAINNFMKPITEDLEEHYTAGVYINSTHKYPMGRTVCSVVPITSMDTLAARAFGGIGGASHTIFCSFCNATLPQIDIFDTSRFSDRSMDQHRLHVARWLSATTLKDRETVWLDHAARHSEWLRFDWWNVFTGLTIAPMHWMKNAIQKQVRENMGSSNTVCTGIPYPPPLSRPISILELKWGELAMAHSSAKEMTKSKLPEPLVRYMCRQRGIFEAGLSSSRLFEELNRWRVNQHIIRVDGTNLRPDTKNAVSTAKAHYYLSKATKSSSALETNSTIPALRQLCVNLGVAMCAEDKKPELIKRLMKYHKRIRTPHVEEEDEARKVELAVLGKEIIQEIRQDMERTQLPSFLKRPPINFSTIDHGKIGAEEYKSLALVSLPITLIRLWGHPVIDTAFRERLDHFMHLSMAVRILSYQTLTSHDISLFEYHYHQYLLDLKELYPFSSITPVQHLGMHIPHFLRALGPTSRYTENPAEMFIGMLEDISTNNKFGELEQTLHHELIMAANLKAVLRNGLSVELEQFGEVVGKFLKDRYPSSVLPTSGWQTIHSDKATTLDQDTISFRVNGSPSPVRGRIDTILQEPTSAVPILSAPRIALVVRAFKPLSREDSQFDPYTNHPLVGHSRFNIMSLYYDSVESQKVYIIKPGDVIAHLVVASYHDLTENISVPCIVVMDLDLKHASFD